MLISRITSTMLYEFSKKDVQTLTEKNKQVNKINLTDLSGLETLNGSSGFVCDMETGICGPAEEITQNKSSNEEKKNANNSMV